MAVDPIAPFQPMSPMPPDAADPPFAQLRVLVLDDDHLLLEVVREMLATCGPCQIVLELDARQALARLDEAMPDVLICDLVLPEMDGIEFLQAAASLGYAGRVILLSALEDEVREAAAELARALGLRVVGSFRKPLTPEQLRHALEC
jgi:CheY-like chemotaxis protein